MRIAILGATSQIAKDLIESFSVQSDYELILFARRPEAVLLWMDAVALSKRYVVSHFNEFGSDMHFDAILNFVGVGDPAQAASLGASIFDITLQYDQIALDYLRQHSSCRYLFLSSGAAYGSIFLQPATRDTPATLPINNLTENDWYGAAKLYAECRHRAHPQVAIIDIRVFNYFSRTQDINASFFITDILRSICNKAILKTSLDYIVRDFLHPADFHQLVNLLLSSPPENTVVDCYSKAPIDKPTLLSTMKNRFALRYEISETKTISNVTGTKPHYYSLNRRAADFGYTPHFTSIEGLLQEFEAVLKKANSCHSA